MGNVVGPNAAPGPKAPAAPAPSQALRGAVLGRAREGSGAGFHAVLEQEVRRGAALRFSGHAQLRLQAAGVTMSPQDLARLAAAVERAEAKGARSSLILMDDMAFVVSIKNRTVITAIDRQRAKDNVFTQIDSAVIT